MRLRVSPMAPGRGAGRRPGRLEIEALRQQSVLLGGWQNRSSSGDGGEPLLLAPNLGESGTSASRSFQRRSSSPPTRRFAGSPASYWRIVLAARQVCLVPRLSEGKLRLPLRLGRGVLTLRHRRERGLDPERGEQPQRLGPEVLLRGRIDAHAAAGDVGPKEMQGAVPWLICAPRQP